MHRSTVLGVSTNAWGGSIGVVYPRARHALLTYMYCVLYVALSLEDGPPGPGPSPVPWRMASSWKEPEVRLDQE